jgi:hypothetical protein
VLPKAKAIKTGAGLSEWDKFSICELVIDQQIKDKENDWQIKWELFANPYVPKDKFTVDGPSTSLEIGTT